MMGGQGRFLHKVFTQRLNLWKINDTMKSFMLNPELGKMMCQLEGVEGIRVWHDQTLIKEPFAQRDRLAPGQSLLVVLLAPLDLHLDRAGGRDAVQRLHVFHSRHAEAGDLRQRRHRAEHGRPLQDLPEDGRDRPGAGADEGGRLQLPQRPRPPTAPAPT